MNTPRVVCELDVMRVSGASYANVLQRDGRFVYIFGEHHAPLGCACSADHRCFLPEEIIAALAAHVDGLQVYVEQEYRGRVGPMRHAEDSPLSAFTNRHAACFPPRRDACTLRADVHVVDVRGEHDFLTARMYDEPLTAPMRAWEHALQVGDGVGDAVAEVVYVLFEAGANEWEIGERINATRYARNAPEGHVPPFLWKIARQASKLPDNVRVALRDFFVDRADDDMYADVWMEAYALARFLARPRAPSVFYTGEHHARVIAEFLLAHGWIGGPAGEDPGMCVTTPVLQL